MFTIWKKLKKDKRGDALLFVIIFGFLFEGVVPVFDATTTRDPFDILAYLAGGLVVYIVGSMGRQKRISTQQD